VGTIWRAKTSDKGDRTPAFPKLPESDRKFKVLPTANWRQVPLGGVMRCIGQHIYSITSSAAASTGIACCCARTASGQRRRAA
jgi:hypothetical protein